MSAAPASRPLLLGMGWFPDQPGGLNRYLRDLARALAGGGSDVRAVVVGPVSRQPEDPEVLAVPGARSVPRRMLAYARVAARAGRTATVVDAHFALYAFLPIVVPAVASRIRRLPLVVHFQGPWADESASAGEQRRWVVWAKRRLERAVYRRARHIVVLSGAFRRLLVERYGVVPWGITVIPPGVDLHRFRPGDRAAARTRLRLPDDHWVCVAVRRQVPRMGLDTLLRAWSTSLGEDPRAVLVLAGDGPLRSDLEALAARLGIASRVRFLGWVSEDDLVACYRSADACVVPSVALEGFGLVALESLACGTPVIATDVGGLPDALVGLDPSAIVPAGDSGALARRLLAARTGARALPDPAACRAHAEEFSWRQVAARNQEVYRAASAPGRPRGVRVVYLDHYGGLSGGELALARLLPALSGVDAHVIVAEPGPLLDRLGRAGISTEVLALADRTRTLARSAVHPRALPLRAVWDSGAYVARLAWRLRRFRPDLVHTNSLKAAVYGGLAGRLAGVPVVWHVRDRIAADYLPKPAVAAVRALAHWLPARVICNSEATAATLGLPGDRVTVVPSPIAVGPVPERRAGAGRRGGAEGLRVGILGRIAPWKGQHVFLEAFARAFGSPRGTGCGATAVILGSCLFGEDDYEARIRALALELGIAGDTEWAGYVDDLAPALGALDILVHASVIPEPFGQVVVEGMAAGLPVVAAAAGGPKEVIEDGVTGLLFPPGDVDALSGVLLRLAGDPELRSRLGRSGRVRAQEFTPAAIAPRISVVYDGLLAGGRA
ncbi:MAG TPA: glycosyltransferase family 4 protein [Actinomycetota bacterium]|nr:glycosyltransferase family 4 protein [Actinomycetota bacterium]